MAKEVWHLRVESSDMQAFKKRCEEIGVEHNEFGRIMIRAFISDRLQIIPSEEDIERSKLYHES